MVKGDNLIVTARQLENGTRGCKLVLFTNRKSYTGFRLVPGWYLHRRAVRGDTRRRSKQVVSGMFSFV